MIAAEIRKQMPMRAMIKPILASGSMFDDVVWKEVVKSVGWMGGVHEGRWYTDEGNEVIENAVSELLRVVDNGEVAGEIMVVVVLYNVMNVVVEKFEELEKFILMEFAVLTVVEVTSDLLVEAAEVASGVEKRGV